MMRDVYHCAPTVFYAQPARIIAMHRRFMAGEARQKPKEEGRARQLQRRQKRLGKP